MSEPALARPQPVIEGARDRPLMKLTTRSGTPHRCCLSPATGSGGRANEGAGRRATPAHISR